MSLVSELKAPSPELFFSRKDTDADPRMGDTVKTGIAAYPEAEVVIVGYPVDEGVRRNEGRTGAADGPEAIRKALYRLPSVIPSDRIVVCDMGDIHPERTLEESQKSHQHVVEGVIRDGKLPIVLGGGNDVSFADVSALATVYPDPLAFNVDTHFDVRESDSPHSGTPYRQLLEANVLKPSRFYEMGIKPEATALEHHDFLANMGVTVHSLGSLRDNGVTESFERILAKVDSEAVFWGIDLDCVRSSDAPGVSAPYPTGLTAEEICRIAETAGRHPKTRLFEISEMNPRYDVDNRTATLAAMIITRFLRAYQVNRKRRIGGVGLIPDTNDNLGN